MNHTPASERRSIFFSAISGNILEYYDFTVYSVFAIIIGKTFFPAEDEVAQILYSLAIFAVGFFTRPMGGIIFGYIGDRFGRRISLIISMLGMTIPTFTIGLIPSFDSIGYYAPAILVVMRLIQGLCISGEGAGAAIFILEHYKNFRPGFTAGLVHGSNIAGTLLATFIGIWLNQHTSDMNFAWRFAFLLGGVMGLAGFYFRLRVSETPIFEMLSRKKKTLKYPFMHVVKTAWKAMFITFCLGGAASSIVYLVKTYINVFYCDVMHFTDVYSLTYVAYSSSVMMFAMPLSGYISDIIGRFKMIQLSTVAIILLSLPALMMMNCTSTLQQIIALTILAMLAGFISGTAYIFIISLFTTAQRFTGVAFSYNLGIALFGGTSPMIARFLVAKTGLYYAPAFYIITTSSAFCAIIYFMRGTIKDLIYNNMQV